MFAYTQHMQRLSLLFNGSHLVNYLHEIPRNMSCHHDKGFDVRGKIYPTVLNVYLHHYVF